MFSVSIQCCAEFPIAHNWMFGAEDRFTLPVVKIALLIGCRVCHWIFFFSQVMVENSDFTPSQVGCLFTFLARQLAKPDNTLFVNRMLFDQVSKELQARQWFMGIVTASGKACSCSHWKSMLVVKCVGTFTVSEVCGCSEEVYVSLLPAIADVKGLWELMSALKLELCN